MDKIEVIEVKYNAQKVGRLALTKDTLCAFEYDTEFLQNGFSLSPYFLPLQKGVFTARREPFYGNFGVFDDSLPDGWGALILDRYLKSKDINSAKLTVLQRLALAGTTGRGALEYFPDNSPAPENGFLDYDKLAAEAGKILNADTSCLVERDEEGLLEQLYQCGSSSGGARPKIFVKTDNKEYLVKFKAAADPENIGKTEYDYSLLARKCGIEMPETRLFEGKYFGVERFDRTAKGKIHTISAAGLLNVNYRIPALDYSDLLKIGLNLTRDMEKVYQLFKLMIFNAVISNRDDHTKNFSFQYVDNRWKLSPAYDLLPSRGFNGWHTTTINGKGEAKMKDILQISKELSLSKKRTDEILEQIIETCKTENRINFRLV